MVWPHPTEVATLTVDGDDFSDWETVAVKHQFREKPLYHVRFTCSENAPLRNNWAALHIMPGSPCTVTLGGELAFTGKVSTRQVFYDSKRHHIEIQCVNHTEVMTGSVVHGTMEWRDKKMEQIMREVLQPVKLNLVVEGGALPSEPIPIVRATPSETIFQFMDNLVRHGSQNSGIGISFTSNVKGDFVVVVGPSGGADQVTEGENILEGRETIYDPYIGGDKVATAGQAPGTNKIWGAHASHIPFIEQSLNMAMGQATGAPRVVATELPGIAQQFLKGRTTTERNWMLEDLITVFATVQGWLRPSGGLWRRGQNVTVNAPMLVMNGIDLILKSVTFTQDDRTGTRSILELVNANVLQNLAPQENE